MSQPLYEISAEIDALIDEAIDRETGEIKSEEMNALLDELEGKREQKCLNIACFIIDLEKESEKISDRAHELQVRAQALARKSTWLRKYIGQNLAPGSKLSDDRVTLSVGPGVEKVVIEKELMIPAHLLKVVSTPMKKEIGEAIRRGEIPEEVAYFDRSDPVVRIR